MYRLRLFITLVSVSRISTLNLDYLDPTKLQTRTAPSVQQDAALSVISKYSSQVTVEVNPQLFRDNKDSFALRSAGGLLSIRASSGVAALWGFHYFLKKYCNSHIGWQVRRVQLPSPLPDVDEVVVAQDRFRYYQNVCTASYSFVWWNVTQWRDHVEWMALNGINLALAPVAQEAAWAKIYRRVGLTEDEISAHFTGPAFLAWSRMGNVRGWGGPLYKSWHTRQQRIHDSILDVMYNLGMVPVLPAFSGHVPKAFLRIFPNTTFYSVSEWNRFEDEYCCGLYVDPNSSLFEDLGKQFLTEISSASMVSHIYYIDPFNEIIVEPWSTELVVGTARRVFSILTSVDSNAVWLLQNWMFINAPDYWPKETVKSFLTSIPNGRFLVLDLHSEQWPKYDVYNMYFGQPFIWCMLHNFGGTSVMFGNMQTIDKDVYEVRNRVNSNMIGTGLTPEGINQNYVVYELMLESAWREEPVRDLETWTSQYATRRYGCNATSTAWRYLLKSVYKHFNNSADLNGQYIITSRPNFESQATSWYTSEDLFAAFKHLAFVNNDSCFTSGYYHDLVDVTRQALQYRANQLYSNILKDRFSDSSTFNSTINQFLDALNDMEKVLCSHENFAGYKWFIDANFTSNATENSVYQRNARNQVTLWGPNGELSDYASKQWGLMFHYYYRPRWAVFLKEALDANIKNETFDEKAAQILIRLKVEEPFEVVEITKRLPSWDIKSLAMELDVKWYNFSGIDLPSWSEKLLNMNNKNIQTVD